MNDIEFTEENFTKENFRKMVLDGYSDDEILMIEFDPNDTEECRVLNGLVKIKTSNRNDFYLYQISVDEESWDDYGTETYLSREIIAKIAKAVKEA
jgi:hypothetical protein